MNTDVKMKKSTQDSSHWNSTHWCLPWLKRITRWIFQYHPIRPLLLLRQSLFGGILSFITLDTFEQRSIFWENHHYTESLPPKNNQQTDISNTVIKIINKRIYCILKITTISTFVIWKMHTNNPILPPLQPPHIFTPISTTSPPSQSPLIPCEKFPTCFQSH